MTPAHPRPITHHPPRRGIRRLTTAAAVLVGLLTASHSAAQELQQFRSRSYLIHTNLTRDEVRAFGKHMDTVYAQYEERFREFHTRSKAQMPLYLLRTEDQYQRFMTSQNIDATNTGGMFFFSPTSQGLATWTQGRSRSQAFQVLQHEGFHQFAFNRLGRELPTWINEGLAQYFEDAIIVGDHMTTGLANARRVEQVRRALESRTAIDFAWLVGISADQWSDTLRGEPDRAALMYAQSWSVVFFLIHGENDRYQPAFARYLQKVSAGRDSQTAFREVFGEDSLRPLASRWAEFADKQQPDPLNTAASRMEFLGEALRFMYQRGEPAPRTLARLRDSLQARHFVLTRKAHGITTEVTADDPDLYRYRRHNGSTGLFKLLEPARDDLPQRITATGLNPEPTLVWSRDADGKLVQDIEYR
jgi:Protein of unknown function (DUF1570)